MIIKYGCATLRPIEDRDFDLLYMMINDPDVEDMTIGWHYPIGENQQREFMKSFINSDKSIKLMIELSNGKTIGIILADDIDWKNRTVMTGYKISAPVEDRIRGDMVDAIIGFNNYLFNELGMNCIYGTILKDNIFALKLTRKMHSTVEGVLRQRVFKRGKYHDLLSVSTLRDEFNEAFNLPRSE